MAVDRVARCMAMDAGGGTAPVDSYTKSETDALLEQKADKSEVTESITAAVAQIVADAPEDFDTLQEMSDWIASHEDSAAAMNSAILQNAADIETVETQQTEQAAEISAVTEEAALNRSTLGYQRKNLLINNCVTRVKNGVTATVNDDGSITMSGSNNGQGFLIFSNIQTGLTSSQHTNNKKWLPNGKYILSGSANGIDLQIRLSEVENSEGILVKSSNGNETIFTVTDAHKYVWARVLIVTGADFGSEGVTVYPMIRLADITDDTYEPYKPSIQEQIDALIDRISALEASQTDMVTSQNISDKIITMNVEDEKHERTENLEQTD